MMSTGKISGEEKKVKTEEVQQYHMQTAAALAKGIPFFIIPKATFMNNGQRKIGFFESELNVPKRDLYVELVSLNTYEPTDPDNRTLYRLRYNEHFRQEYEAGNHPNLYYVPFDELEKVWSLEDTKKFLSTRDLNVSNHYKRSQPQQSQPATSQTQISTQSYNDKLPDFDLDDLQDDHFNKMTIRDLAAILWKAPVSKKQWLNDLINNT